MNQARALHVSMPAEAARVDVQDGRIVGLALTGLSVRETVPGGPH
jgi:hypothetical protein